MMIFRGKAKQRGAGRCDFTGMGETGSERVYQGASASIGVRLCKPTFTFGE
jgi:hypothetical protein